MKRWDHLIGPSHHYAISDVLLRQHRNAIIIGFVENTGETAWRLVTLRLRLAAAVLVLAVLRHGEYRAATPSI